MAESTTLPDTARHDETAANSRPRATPLRFKDDGADTESRHSKRRRLSSDDDDAAKADPDHGVPPEGKRHRHHTRRHRRHHRRGTDSERKPSVNQDRVVGDDETSLDPDAAFRESLFDAMADDEGADYWEGIYGQPVHVYPNTRQGPEGDLERMTDEEYVAHVRASMWAKTHQGILEERARREQAARERQEQKQKAGQARADTDSFNRQMEESLRRGEHRRARKGWQQAYETYSKRWEALRAGKAPDQAAKTQIPWPVRSGAANDVSPAAVEAFMRQTEEFSNDGHGHGAEAEAGARLKAERVRWHPDKMQQRLGAEGLDETELKLVTAIFQVLDSMWSRERERKK